jgi:hypothetical protein
MRQVKHAKTLLVLLTAAGCATAAFALLRPASAGNAPPAWMIDAAVAMSRAEIAAAGHSAEGPLDPARGNHAAAAAAYREAIRVNPMDADAWADLADSLAAAAGHDLGAGREAIMHALAIDPRHRKALWLRASLELQEQRYGVAAATWRELQTLVAAGSADARVIAANIAEADALEAAARSSGGG